MSGPEREPGSADERALLASMPDSTPEYPEAELEDFEYVAESCEQGEIIRDLLSSLAELARARGWTRVYFGADNYFAWVPSEPQLKVSPDVYLLDDPPDPRPRSWKTWLQGHRPPRWAVEIVSEDWRKDYELSPRRYAQLGCAELVLFDPLAARGMAYSRRRVPLTVFRREPGGAFKEAYRGAGPAFSRELDCWLHSRPEGCSMRLRLAEDEAGQRLVPTIGEARDALQEELRRLKRK